ncbi:MAG: LiaF-related protein [Arachidicoccus sp.]|nr:LiaF-related protein [Arachidicoccus sp.]
MENEEKKPDGSNADIHDTGFQYDTFRRRDRHNTLLPGLIIVIAGVIILLKRLPQTAALFPEWLFDWPVILIVIGFIGGARHGFRYNFGWLIPLFFGIYFLLKDRHLILDKWDAYIFPVLLIAFGILLLIKRRHCRSHIYDRNDMRFYNRMKRKQEYWQAHNGRFRDRHAEFKDNSNENFVDINTLFGKAEKTMFTKNFKGGSISCSFGGGELNLSQADIEDTAVLNIAVTFGGLEITVPANWTIQNELTVLMGGIEDKRRISSQSVPPKILILKGNVFCGGVELKN